jgi:branched-subunit amino acid aminotransferase/4-amino-4-deoxychorismate lyase
VDTDRTLARPGEDYGHFTAMQIRGWATRGLRLHLARLDEANRELFGEPVDGDVVRRHIRRALGDRVDASVRFSVRRPAETPAGRPEPAVAVDDPVAMPAGPLRLRSVRYQRPLTHLKHLATRGKTRHRDEALAAGYDEALLTSEAGEISEGAITNVGFFDGASVVWPAAPALSGITMQLLVPALADRGIPSERRPVGLGDVGSFAAAFVTNSWGIAVVGAIDDVEMPIDDEFALTVAAAYESVPWDPI